MELVWSGALERDGRAPGLSQYRGHSQLYRPRTRARRETPPEMVGDDERQANANNECRRRRRARQRAAGQKVEG